MPTPLTFDFVRQAVVFRRGYGKYDAVRSDLHEGVVHGSHVVAMRLHGDPASPASVQFHQNREGRMRGVLTMWSMVDYTGIHCLYDLAS